MNFIELPYPTFVDRGDTRSLNLLKPIVLERKCRDFPEYEELRKKWLTTVYFLNEDDKNLHSELGYEVSALNAYLFDEMQKFKKRAQ